MKLIDYQAVAQAATAIEQTGQQPTNRLVRDHLGGGSFATIAPLLRKFKESRAATEAGSRTLSAEVVASILAEVQTASGQAARLAAQRAQEAEDAFDLLQGETRDLGEQLAEAEAQLDFTRSELLDSERTLKERMRELDDAREYAANAIAQAQELAHSERKNASALQSEVVRLRVRLEQYPSMQAELEKLRQLVSDGQSEIARAQQCEAVAREKADQLIERAAQAATREERTEAALLRAQEDRDKALVLERLAQREVLSLSNCVVALEARCAAQDLALSKLRQASVQAEPPMGGTPACAVDDGKEVPVGESAQTPTEHTLPKVV